MSTDSTHNIACIFNPSLCGNNKPSLITPKPPVNYTPPPPVTQVPVITNTVPPIPTQKIINYNYYPYTSINTPQKMNITNNGTMDGISQNISSLIDYNNALYSGNTMAFTQSTNGKPFGSRYFSHAYETCLSLNGTATVDRYYPIDNMMYSKNTNGQIDTSNYGLLYSAQPVVNKIGIAETDLSNNDRCVQVTMVTDQFGSIDSKYVKMSDYNNLDCTAFQNNCKKYLGMKNCEPCNSVSTVPTTTAFPTNYSFAQSLNNNEFIPVTSYSVSGTNENPVIVKTESFRDINGLYDENDDFLTIIYVGSLSIVGIYILYNFMKKNKFIE
jgi:hypothetical protein